MVIDRLNREALRTLFYMAYYEGIKGSYQFGGSEKIEVDYRDGYITIVGISREEEVDRREVAAWEWLSEKFFAVDWGRRLDDLVDIRARATRGGLLDYFPFDFLRIESWGPLGGISYYANPETWRKEVRYEGKDCFVRLLLFLPVTFSHPEVDRIWKQSILGNMQGLKPYVDLAKNQANYYFSPEEEDVEVVDGGEW